MGSRMTFAMGERDGDRQERSWEVSPKLTMLKSPECLIAKDSEDNGEGTCKACMERDSQSRESHPFSRATAFNYTTLRFTCSLWAPQLSAEIN